MRDSLCDFQLSKKLKDELVWKKEMNGIYTAKSFSKSIVAPKDKIDGIWKQVWANLASRTVETFVWQLLYGKIVVKEKLTKKGVLNINSLQCVLCNSDRETCNHLFVTCSETWKV